MVGAMPRHGVLKQTETNVSRSRDPSRYERQAGPAHGGTTTFESLNAKMNVEPWFYSFPQSRLLQAQVRGQQRLHRTAAAAAALPSLVIPSFD